MSNHDTGSPSLSYQTQQRLLTEKDPMGNAPVKKFTASGIVVNVWANTAERDGKKETYHTFDISRGYKDKEGKWQNTGSLRRSDLLVASELLRQAFAFEGGDE